MTATNKPRTNCKRCNVIWNETNRATASHCYKCNAVKTKEWNAANPERVITDRLKPGRKFSNYRSSAKRRNISFDLTYDDFMQLWQKPCSYCGSKIATVGIDRVDNNIGYKTGNVVSCCQECNYVKQERSQKQMFDHMLRTLRFQGLI